MEVRIIKDAIIYQDMRFHRWPMKGCRLSQIFNAEYTQDKTEARLTAYGYGVHKRPDGYGNGAIWTSTENLIPLNNGGTSLDLIEHRLKVATKNQPVNWS